MAATAMSRRGIWRERGVEVRVAALADPTSDAAKWARGQWNGPVETLETAAPAPLLIDCLFGTGLKKPLDEAVSEQLLRLAAQSRCAIACDVPSGADSDSGALLSPVPDYADDGHIRRIEAGASAGARFVQMRPDRPCRHRNCRSIRLDTRSAGPYCRRSTRRGTNMTAGWSIALPARCRAPSLLAASAAARTGAGYVRISTSRSIDGLPSAIVQTETAEINDPRIGAILVGPGLGDIPQVLTLALTGQAPVVIDADAIGLVGEPERLKGHDAIVTPHEGEFARLFGEIEGSKAERALEAARRSGAVVVYKGPDTFVAAPDGRVWVRAARAGLACKRGDGRRARRNDRGAEGARDAIVRRCLGRRLAARPRRRDRRAGDDRRRSCCGNPRRSGAPAMSEAIVRIAARGEGVTASGRHVAFAVPGDMLGEDGHDHARSRPPAAAMPSLSRMRRVPAAACLRRAPIAIISGTGSPARLPSTGSRTEVRAAYLSPPNTRRRAALRALKLGKGVALGFNAAKSNQIVDMRECHILAPELVRLGRATPRPAGDDAQAQAHRRGPADTGRSGRRCRSQGRGGLGAGGCGGADRLLRDQPACSADDRRGARARKRATSRFRRP